MRHFKIHFVAFANLVFLTNEGEKVFAPNHNSFINRWSRLEFFFSYNFRQAKEVEEEKPAPKTPKKAEKSPPKKVEKEVAEESNGDQPKRGRGRPPKRASGAAPAKAAPKAKKGKIYLIYSINDKILPALIFCGKGRGRPAAKAPAKKADKDESGDESEPEAVDSE